MVVGGCLLLVASCSLIIMYCFFLRCLLFVAWWLASCCMSFCWFSAILRCVLFFVSFCYVFVVVPCLLIVACCLCFVD